MDRRVLDKLKAIVGEDYISTREDVLLAYSETASMAKESVKPGVVVRPGTVDEVTEILRLCNVERISVTPRSGGSSLQGEAIPKVDGLVLELLRLQGITLHEDLRSVTVGAGVTFGELDKFLSKYNLWVPVSPESGLVCTIAGNVAVNGAGPGSSSFGPIAEMVVGLEVVLPTGEVIQTGSSASPYSPGPFLRYAFGPDITGLFIGSLGGLGVITKVSLKTYKRIENFHYDTYGFDTAEQAARFLLEIKSQGVQPMFASIYEGGMLNLFMDMLGEEFSIPKHDWPNRTVSMTLGRVRKDMLESDVSKTEEICREIGGHVIGIGELPKGEWEKRLWTFVRCCYAHGFHWRTLYHHQTPINSSRSVEEITKAMDNYGFLGHTAGFLAGHSTMNMYPHLYFDPLDEEEEGKVVRAHDELASTLYETGAVPFKLAPYWEGKMKGTEDYMLLLQTVKDTLDPNGVMNPGVMGGI
ncbi:MAG: FAD-binding oxidoreductase [Candidatus Thorarchaeota archaeon]|nr:FAD-binding oxidoreductase [Candidatus Thorarchaeota archaeon]